MQTCELVGLDKVPKVEPNLGDWDYGDYEGKRSVEIRKERLDWNVFRDGCPHGEMPSRVSDQLDLQLPDLLHDAVPIRLLAQSGPVPHRLVRGVALHPDVDHPCHPHQQDPFLVAGRSLSYVGVRCTQPLKED
ncbi:MAG: hypothetical protein L6271_09150 [Desulfobacteraceae bacterium]|nr:hypothetical protein [Desulfobacteraceae bacterium]